MKSLKLGLILLLLCVVQAAVAQTKPNIVLVFMDNFGRGEPGFNGGGIIRGAATPRLDQLADEGLRLTNGRFPTDQGFDEWYGIPNSTDESVYSSLQDFAESGVAETYVMDGKKGGVPKKSALIASTTGR